MTQKSDAELFAASAAGEEAAFLALYRRWQANVYRFALRLSGSQSIAEDVTQEVFLTLVNGKARFNPELGGMAAYLYGIARNQVLRRMKRERIFTSLAREPDPEVEERRQPSSAAPDALAALTRQESVALLHRAIATLPVHYREVVLLCELHEMDYATAARLVGCPEGTVRSRLHRARSLLLERLRGPAAEKTGVSGIEPLRCLS